MINNMEPYKIKMIERINFSSINERERWIKEAHYNLFNLKSNREIKIFCCEVRKIIN